MPSHRASRCPRPLAGQLHRFIGTRSGRKSRYATLLADALDPARTRRHRTGCWRCSDPR